jgi:protease I
MRLDDQHVAVFVADGFEDLEFWVAVMRLREEGARVTVAGAQAGETYTGKHCLTAVSDVAAAELRAEAFAAVVVPGGWAPDKLRR